MFENAKGKSCLLVSKSALGDFIGITVPLAWALRDEGYEVSLLIWQDFRLKEMASHIPAFKHVYHVGVPNSTRAVFSLINDHDCIADFTSYKDRKFGPLERFLGSPDKSIGPGQITLSGGRLRTQEYLACYGLEFKKCYLRIEISWYKDYFKNFSCSDRSILVHCWSADFQRSYFREQELVVEFAAAGFDVKFLDSENNLCQNLFLIAQSTWIVSVDTSIIWFAQALGKSPFCIHPSTTQASHLGILPGRSITSIVLNQLSPKEISEKVLSEIGLIVQTP